MKETCKAASLYSTNILFPFQVLHLLSSFYSKEQKALTITISLRGREKKEERQLLAYATHGSCFTFVLHKNSCLLHTEHVWKCNFLDCRAHIIVDRA